MDRIYESNAAASPPSPPATPSSGYPTAGDPGNGIPATLPGDYWYHMITESLVQVIESAGLQPDHTVLTQLRDAINTLIVNNSPPGLGVNQTWVDVTAQRSAGITYTNSAGRPIVVAIDRNNAATANFYIDGNIVQTVVDATGAPTSFLSWIIPDGSTYMLDDTGGVVRWMELR